MQENPHLQMLKYFYEIDSSKNITDSLIRGWKFKPKKGNLLKQTDNKHKWTKLGM